MTVVREKFDGRECRRDGCTEVRYSGLGMELHLANDHESPFRFRGDDGE
jgi:hypothetical protein